MAEWIEHDGKGTPVDGNALVYVHFSDGYEDTTDKYGKSLDPSHADEWGSNWTWPVGHPTFGDIVAYRLHTPTPSTGTAPNPADGGENGT